MFLSLNLFHCSRIVLSIMLLVAQPDVLTPIIVNNTPLVAQPVIVASTMNTNPPSPIVS